MTAEPQKDGDCDTCMFGEQCRYIPYVPPCYHQKPAKESDAVLDEFKKWFDKYCECDEEADAYMVFHKAYLIYKRLRTKER